jgi:PAS domain S-box-containing protein
MLGYATEAEMIGRPAHATIHHSRADGSMLPLSDCHVHRAIQDNRPTHSDADVYWRRDGTAFAVECWAHPMVQDGVVVGAVVTFIDITQRKAMQEELTRSNAELEQFAYVASHDLQTPLRNIVSYTQLLERRYKDRIDADADDFIGFIVDSSKQMTRLINDLLEYSRVSSQSKPLRPVPAGDAVAQALRNLRGDLETAAAEVAVGDLPLVMAEPSHLASLFQNLLGNGLKYRMPGRRPRLSVTAERSAADRWTFAVADNGIGIEPQYFDKIFEIFQRLNPASEREGTGIGLTLCRRIVHRFGGTIWVDSVPGVGTTFFFTLRDGSAA